MRFCRRVGTSTTAERQGDEDARRRTGHSLHQSVQAQSPLLRTFRRATSNKRAWKWVIGQGPRVTWVPEARWVEDGNVFTAGGVAAGIDMSLAVIARLVGLDAANKVAEGAEYDWHRDASWDPFAKAAGLV